MDNRETNNSLDELLYMVCLTFVNVYEVSYVPQPNIRMYEMD